MLVVHLAVKIVTHNFLSSLGNIIPTLSYCVVKMGRGHRDIGNIAIIALFLIHCLLRWTQAQNLAPYAKEVGPTWCYYLAMKSQLPRKFFTECGQPTCSWDSWHDNLAKKPAANTKERYVLSYAHNGFGNQLWQHTIAFMIAESLQARFFIQAVPDILCPDGVSPPNTWKGMGAMQKLLPEVFLYDALPRDSPIRQLCDGESFFLADRPRDWRNGSYTGSFKSNIHSLVTDKSPRCIKLLGYFQGYPLCREDTKQLWTPRLIANFTMTPGPNDISIYLRCVPRHYFFNDRHFYETILNNTRFDKVWLFQAPECPTKLDKDPSRDGQVASVVRLLVERFNATRWPMYQGEDDSMHLLHDLAGLVQSKKLIIPVSSWAYWAGLLSNATEIHVNGPPYHPMMAGMMQYIYHDQKKRLFFGRFNNKTNDIDFEMNHPETPVAVVTAPTSSGSSKTPPSVPVPVVAAVANAVTTPTTTMTTTAGTTTATVTFSDAMAIPSKHIPANVSSYSNSSAAISATINHLGAAAVDKIQDLFGKYNNKESMRDGNSSTSPHPLRALRSRYHNATHYGHRRASNTTKHQHQRQHVAKSLADG